MTSIAIIGGTGYSGGNIAAEAVHRSHTVTALSRQPPEHPLPGIRYVKGSANDEDLITALALNHDVLFVAIHAVDAADRPVLPAVVPRIAAATTAGDARLGVVGGAGSLLRSESSPRLIDSGGVREQFKPEASTQAEILEWLRAQPDTLDWFYLSPAAEYGSHAPGTATGTYRTGDDIVVVAEDGSSRISGADFALAFIDEIETPTHRRTRFTVGY